MVRTLTLLGYLMTHHPGYQDHMTVVAKKASGRLSPYLQIQGVPPEAGSLVLVIKDVSRRARYPYHWLVYNLSPDTHTIPVGISQHMRLDNEGRNSWGEHAFHTWPTGKQSKIRAEVLALDQRFSVKKPLTGPELSQRLHGHVLASAQARIG